MEFPNLRHLRAFKEVAERQSVSAAAEHVHLSQPAVTQAIGGLERRLGVSLFERRPEGMFATASGAGFLRRVQRVFELLDRGAAEAVHLAGRKTLPASPGFVQHVSASQLRALIGIWETGSFSLAARKIGISQPSVHRAARDLEKLAGVAFYATSSNGIELTRAGEAFARGGKLAAAELIQAHDELELEKGQDNTRIVIGSMPLSRTSILPDAVHQLIHDSPGVQLRTIEGPYDELLRSLRYGELDLLIGALRDPVPFDDVTQEALFDDPLSIVVGAGHPLVGCSGVTLADVMRYPWIAPPKPTPTGAYLFRTLKIGELAETPVRIVSSSLVFVRGMLMRGDYVTVMSRHQMAVEREQGLLVPLDTPLPDSARSIGITTRTNWLPTPTQTRFLSLLRQASTVSYA